MYIYSYEKKPVFAKSAFKITTVSLFLILYISIGEISQTGAFFSSASSLEKSSTQSGYWIPVLEMEVRKDETEKQKHKEKKKKKDKKKHESVCIWLESSVTDKEKTKIFYSLSGKEGEIKGEYEEKCIEIPKGEWDFSAYAIFDDNENWKSNVVSGHFEVKKDDEKKEKEKDKKDNDEDDKDDEDKKDSKKEPTEEEDCDDSKPTDQCKKEDDTKNPDADNKDDENNGADDGMKEEDKALEEKISQDSPPTNTENE